MPQSARIWNYWLGGKDYYPVDQQAGDQYIEVFPGIVDIARASRAFPTRAVRYLASEAGGPSVPGHRHRPADRQQHPSGRSAGGAGGSDRLCRQRPGGPCTRSCPADQHPEEATDYVDADLRDPDTILEAAEKTLDFTRPVALMLMGILGHVADYDEARSIVRRLLDPLPSGSNFTLNDGTNVISKEFEQAQEGYNKSGAVPYVQRSPEQIAGFFGGLELVEPGVVSCPRWRPDPTGAAGDPPAEVDAFGGVGRKP